MGEYITINNTTYYVVNEIKYELLQIKDKYDITGLKFNRLTVRGRVAPPEYVKDKKSTYWVCECECGNHIVIRRSSIGKTISCGCYKKELNNKKKKSNKYIPVNEEHCIVYDESNKSFVINISDIEQIKNYYWSVGYNKYVSAHINKKKILLHDFLMHPPANMVVDHKDRNPLNNQRNNLRICTDSENTKNKSMNKNNKSGVMGVCWEKTGNWCAYIQLNGKSQKLYRGNDKEVAIKMRLQAELKYYGEFAPQQHLFEKYNIKPKEKNND